MDRTDVGLAPLPEVTPGTARYRHPRGWTVRLAVPDEARPLPTQWVDGVEYHLEHA